MKRALLIAGGTVGGLGAVLSVTPPQLGSNGISTLAGASAATSVPETTQQAAAVTTTAPTADQNTAAVATTKATTKPTTKAKATATKKATSGSSSTTSTSTNAINVGYGIVQVKITVSNGKITDAVAVSAPTGRNQRWSDMAVPNLRSQTLSANSAAINGVSGASYTSYGWYKSLISALQKAGMPTGA